ncbi:MAG: hypothetical protein SVT52_09200 [Planctomycetota bacterium]|nr:hypothetical protein [Planctomycetota bacterium]
MAIPTGTTSRQLAAVARWALASVVVVGMLTWWWPSFRTWGALSAGLGIVFALWVLQRTVAAERTVPGHPVYWVLLAPAAILTVHLAWTGLGTAEAPSMALGGAMNMSMLFQLALLACGVMLSQSLLPRAASHISVLSVCGVAMMGGAAAAMVWGRAEQARCALALLGFAGVGVWLSMLWGLSAEQSVELSSRRGRELQLICIVVAVAAAAGLTYVAPSSAAVAAVVVGVVLFAAGLVFHQRRIILLLAGGILAAAGLWAVRSGLAAIVPAGDVAWFGRGEEAFAAVSAADNGLAVLAATIGFFGAGWLVLGAAACVTWLLCHARRGHAGDQARAIVWTAGAALAGCAMLAPGGLFIPAIMLAVALTWGLLPAMLGRRQRCRSGVVVLAVLAGIALLLGLARRDGLLGWSANAFGGAEIFLHTATGFLLALVLSWLMGGRSVWLGLAGILLAALAGGAGEALQAVASRRGAEWKDWLAHTAGSAAVIVPYLLAVGSRMCESPDARSRDIHKAYHI